MFSVTSNTKDNNPSWPPQGSPIWPPASPDSTSTQHLFNEIQGRLNQKDVHDGSPRKGRYIRPRPFSNRGHHQAPWHFCGVTMKAEASAIDDCPPCGARKGNVCPHGKLGFLPLEIREMIYEFLIPPPLPLATSKNFQDEGREALNSRCRKAMLSSDQDQIAVRRHRERNPLNMMATSKTIYTEIRSLQAFLNRLYSLTFTHRGMSFEHSLPEIEGFTADPVAWLQNYEKSGGDGRPMRFPFMALHTISPLRRLHATFPLPVDESPTPPHHYVGDPSVGLSLTALGHLFELLLKDAAIAGIETLHIRLFLFDRRGGRPWEAIPRPPRVENDWDRMMCIALFPLIGISKKTVNKITISVESDQPQGQKWVWWMAGLEEVTKWIVSRREELTDAGRAEFYRKEKFTFKEMRDIGDLMDRMEQRVEEARILING